MANKTLTELTSAAALDGTENVYLKQGGNSRKGTTSGIRDFILIDEDDFSSDSAVKAPSQQSVKAYFSPKLLQMETAVATSSVTSVTFSLPSGVASITLALSSVTANSSSDWTVELGDTGGFETAGYNSSCERPGVTNSTSSTAFVISVSNDASSTHDGVIELRLVDSSTNTWALNGQIFRYSGTGMTCFSTGNKSLSGELTQIKLYAGGDTFDGGKVNCLYQLGVSA